MRIPDAFRFVLHGPSLKRPAIRSGARVAAADISPRSLTVGYMTALAIVAAMTMMSNVMVGHMLKDQESAAYGVNIAGRQRMLSQRIAGLAAQSVLALPLQADLTRAIDKFEIAHRQLVHGDIDASLDPASIPELQAIYFGETYDLDANVTRFIRHARQLGAMQPGSLEQRQIAQDLFAAAREPLLNGLDAVVSLHQRSSEGRVKTLQQIQLGSLVVTIVTLLIESAFIFRPMVMRIISYTRALKKIAATDPLTGALNRRSFADRAFVELSRASRYSRPTSLLMIDADHFKSINDAHGHAGGDAVLQAMVTSISASLRPSDLLGRLGGEEFGVLLAETDLAGAEVAAERVRSAIAKLRVSVNDASINFTISIGVAAFRPEATGLQHVMELADTALYEAKAKGRNRVVLARVTEPDIASPSLGAAKLQVA